MPPSLVYLVLGLFQKEVEDLHTRTDNPLLLVFWVFEVLILLVSHDHFLDFLIVLLTNGRLPIKSVDDFHI